MICFYVLFRRDSYRASRQYLERMHRFNAAFPAPRPWHVFTHFWNFATSAPAVDSGLLEIKQSALQELTPLIDHLEQTAEEKFRTMMMMIQASDDQSLLTEAYQAAQNIEDKKARAQALLDVVNEINYFTQHADGSSTNQ